MIKNSFFSKSALRCLLLIVNIIGITSYSQEGTSTDYKKQLDTLLEKGREYMDEGQLESAFENFILVKRYSQALGFEELKFISNIELANFYLLKGEPEESQEIFTEIQLKESYQPSTICRYYHRMAFYYNQIGDDKVAKEYSFKSLDIAKKYKITQAMGVSYNELGDLLEQGQQFDSSIFYFNRARQVFDSNSYDYANATYNMSRIHYQQEQYDSVIINLEELMQQIIDEEWYFIKSPSYNYLANSYTFLGDTIKGLLNRELSLRAELEIRNQNHNENLEHLKIAFETEKKNQEIEKHKSDLAKEKAEKQELFALISFLGIFLVLLIVFFLVIRRKNSRLNKLVEENEFLVGEANHRIKNNLQIIVSLVAREIYKRDNQEIDSLRNIGSKIESIATLHQQLYINEEKNEINLSHYLRTLVENLKSIYEAKNIKLEFEIGDLLLYSVSKSIYIGLLFNELIINSIKHAFAENQTDACISVKFYKTKSDKIGFEYADNGLGLKQGVKPKLIDMMCRQLNSKYEMDGSNGYKFKVVV